MSKVEIVKVEGKRQMDDFIRVPWLIYADCPQYVPDIESDVRALFDPKKNAGLAFSDIQPFVAYVDGKPAGRIVGIINRRANEKWKTENVRFSLIEFIDDRDVSKALIETVATWGRDRGMKHIQGPLGMTDFDKEGMLVEDFHLTGSMTAIYNPPYYPQHMEALGFEKEVDWLQVRINIPEGVPAKYARVAEYARTNIGLHVRKLNVRQMMGEEGHKIFDLFNAAYVPIFGFSELSFKQVDSFLKKYVPIVDLNMVPVIENDKGEVVGAAVTMGSLVKALQKAHGRLLPFGWFHLLKALKWKRAESVEMLLIAVRPDYQGLGLNAMFFDNLIPIYNKLGIKWAETGPQLEDNVRELTQWKPLKPEYVKRRRCFVREIG
jgi:GNAT superfamily N-acetyltransferase